MYAKLYVLNEELEPRSVICYLFVCSESYLLQIIYYVMQLRTRLKTSYPTELELMWLYSLFEMN